MTITENSSDVEIVPYSEFHIPARIKSRFIPGRMVDTGKPGELVCPRCSEKNPGLEHFEESACRGCKLRMKRNGNTLYIWEDVL